VEKIQAIMEKLRSEMPKEFGEFKVREIRDYLNSTAYNLQDGGQRSLDLAKSNVMYFELSQNAAFIARPSGTEPKIKMYYLTAGETKQKADETLANVVAAVEKKLF
jgi:phosphoglucomutase